MQLVFPRQCHGGLEFILKFPKKYLFKEYGEDDFSCWSTVDKSTLLFHQHLVAVEQLLLGNASGQVNCCYSELHSMFV